MEARQPERPETEEQREGTAAHELGAAMITALSTGAPLPAAVDVIGSVASNGVRIDEAMYDAALMYADEAHTIMMTAGIYGGPNVRIEQPVAIVRIHPDSWGTPDFSLFDSKAGVLYVRDFKYGHRVVDAWGNWQMIEYVSGLMDAYEIDGHMEQRITVRIGIVQPRAPHRDGPVRYWNVPMVGLRGHINILAAVERESLSDNPTATVGPECLDCKARHDCSLLQEAGSAACAYSGSTAPAPLTAEQLAVELSLITDCEVILKARRSGLEVEAETRITVGEIVPGWSLERGGTREKWAVPTAQVITLGDMMGVNLRKEEQVITPKQAIKAGIVAEVVRNMSETPLGAFKLIRSATTKAAKVFGKLKEGV
jgi:hypothetical protein